MNSHELDMRGTKKLREVVEREEIPKVRFFCNAEVQHPEEQPMACDPRTFKSICRGQPVELKPEQKKPSKKIPLEREWLEFDPELDKKYYWSNVIRVVNGEVTVTPELREVK